MIEYIPPGVVYAFAIFGVINFLILASVGVYLVVQYYRDKKHEMESAN